MLVLYLRFSLMMERYLLVKFRAPLQDLTQERKSNLKRAFSTKHKERCAESCTHTKTHKKGKF